MTRDEINQIYAFDDAARRDFEVWEWRRQQREQPQQLIRKTYVPPEQPRTAAMDQSAWDNWLDKRFDGYMEIIGAEVGREDKKLKDEIAVLRTELDELKSEVILLRAVRRGTVTQIGRKDVA